MRAISLWQPWASLIALRYKVTETRGWDTDVRGRFAIHAAKAPHMRRRDVLELGPFEVTCDQSGLLLRGPIAWPYRLPLGAIVATATLTETRSTDDPTHQPGDVDRALGDHSPGRFAWYLEDIRPVREPIPANGKQGWWAWTPPADFTLEDA